MIAFGTILVFDKWIWPDRGETILLESLGASVARDRSRLLEAANFFLNSQGAARPPLPPPTSDLPAHMDLLNRAIAEGVSKHRHAILLAATTRVARIGLEVDRLTFAARQNVPGEIRAMVRPEIQATVDAIAAVLDEIARELPTHIAVGVDQPPPASRTRARSALDALSARIIQVRPTYIGKASSAEIENFASFTDSLAALTGHIERLLDEPPQPPAAAPSNSAVPRLSDAPDPAARPLFNKGRSLRGDRLCDRHRYPARRSIYNPDDDTNNRASHLRGSPPQDDTADRRSDNRRGGFSSGNHHRHAQFRNSSGLSARCLHSLLCLRVLLSRPADVLHTQESR